MLSAILFQALNRFGIGLNRNYLVVVIIYSSTLVGGCCGQIDYVL